MNKRYPCTLLLLTRLGLFSIVVTCLFVCLFLAFICSSLKKGKFLNFSIGVIDKGIMCQVFLTAGLGVTRGKDTQGKYCPQDLQVVLH